jgi:hypothetical protein
MPITYFETGKLTGNIFLMDVDVFDRSEIRTPVAPVNELLYICFCPLSNNLDSTIG